MKEKRKPTFAAAWITLWAIGTLSVCSAAAGAEESLSSKLDAPLLFVKRYCYVGIHIYDTYYKWRPGGGIYVIENPSAPSEQHRIRALIDPTTPETLGEGIYSEPDISWDAERVLFCFKGQADGSTSIYEIGIDGKGLRRLSDPTPCCDDYQGSLSGQHDVGPAYLPDGRIVFTSTRPSGLVPCFNTGVDILHVMNADGTDMHTISVNNVNEFDPCVLPDGRILHGRWEYVDKTALTQQSLWTIFPDGTNETALFANNMVHPEAVLDARPVPGSEHLVIGTFAPHNSPPRGCIAFVDPRLGKNDPRSIFNLDHPDKPTSDRGESCEPWPLSKDVALYSGRPEGQKLNAIMMTDRDGRREVVYADPNIDCHSPVLVQPRSRPPSVGSGARPDGTTGRFYLQDIYRGLDGVQRGEVKWLRVIEETSRTSASPGGAFNQTFLVSAALAFSVKNYLGVVPVQPDGSAYFEVPSHRAIYLQALDGQRRLVRSMRTFVQAAPGVTRSCIGCHEYKFGSPAAEIPPTAFQREPDRPEPESWGSGFVDYPSMVQPIFDRHCVKCHGGEEGIAAGVDLSGGWTEYFNISYENLISRRETQLTASLIAGIDCMNGTSLWSARILPPRSHGSGAAPLADLLVDGHEGHIPDITRTERDLILAWIDTNGLYHGTWDYTTHGCSIKAWGKIEQALVAQMQSAGCMQCHHVLEDDWINLKRPEFSRILRAPLAEGTDGWGLGLCRRRKLDPRERRIRILVSGQYAHAVMPLESFKVPEIPPPQSEAKPVATFDSTGDPHYREMLAIIRQARGEALAKPRVDMPGAEIIPGECRLLVPVPVPDSPPALAAKVQPDGAVELSWQRTAETIGLQYELHRSTSANFAPQRSTQIAVTTAGRLIDLRAPIGTQYYALLVSSDDRKSKPRYTSLEVPKALPPAAPTALEARPLPGEIVLRWEGPETDYLSFDVYRREAGAGEPAKVTAEPLRAPCYTDPDVECGVKYAYVVRSLDRRGRQSAASSAVEATPLPEIKEPVFVANFGKEATAKLLDLPSEGHAAHAAANGRVIEGRLKAGAKIAEGMLVLGSSGFATFEHLHQFDLTKALSIECWLHVEKESQMPVIVSCGAFGSTGWFLQRIGGGWRWHLGGVSCDGGSPVVGHWVHLVGTFDGKRASLYQDGKQVASIDCHPNRAEWSGPLIVGQYSSQDPKYQVTGRISGVEIYRRAVKPDEIAAKFQAGRE